MRKIAAATVLCLVLSLALFTTGAFAQSANTSVSANTATTATSDWFGGGLFGGGFSSGFFALSVTSVFNFNTFIPFGGGCFSFC